MGAAVGSGELVVLNREGGRDIEMTGLRILVLNAKLAKMGKRQKVSQRRP